MQGVTRRSRVWVVILAILVSVPGIVGTPGYAAVGGPTPVLEKGKPVDWWFVFKFNAHAFPGCGGEGDQQRECPFGGTVQAYPAFSQQFVYASSENPKLQKGSGCVGDTSRDPVGATFDAVYTDPAVSYLIWNDQFYQDPQISGCGDSCGSPWGHSKGMLAWNAAGEGLVLQVTTPSWPAAGSTLKPRQHDGNSLGCIKDNDVKVSQHFFALKLSKADLVTVLKALRNASVVTDPANSQIVRNGGPPDVQDLVQSLGTKSRSTAVTREKLSSGVEVISKPSGLHVPPWQMVSALLGHVPLRTATWWTRPQIYSTTAASQIACWDDRLGTPGPVEIALTGQWEGKTFGLTGGPGADFNHAKVGVSLLAGSPYAIFGDLNQQGAIAGNCASSQNGRGGLFYVLNDEGLFDSLSRLLTGGKAETGPTK